MGNGGFALRGPVYSTDPRLRRLCLLGKLNHLPEFGAISSIAADRHRNRGLVLVRYIALHRPPFGAKVLSVEPETGCGHWVAVRFLFVMALQESEGSQVAE